MRTESQDAIAVKYLVPAGDGLQLLGELNHEDCQQAEKNWRFRCFVVAIAEYEERYGTEHPGILQCSPDVLTRVLNAISAERASMEFH
jgi:hypothetical protein